MGWGGQACSFISSLIQGEGGGVFRVGLEEWPGWSAHPFVVLSAGGMCACFCSQHPVFCSQLLRKSSWILGIFWSRICPTLGIHSYFSPLWFLCILYFKEGVCRCKLYRHCSKGGSRVPSLSLEPLGPEAGRGKGSLVL